MVFRRFIIPARQWSDGIVIERPGRFSPSLVYTVNRWIRPWVRLLFRPTLQGEENLPIGEPFLLIANHSAGLGIAEILCFITLYFERVGSEIPLAGFALPQGFRIFPLNCLLKALGAVPSTYEAARKTLREEIPVLIFPGGDHETLRPVWKANRVDFGGRVGFLKIAEEMQVPVVPMGIKGSHYTCPIVLRAKWLAWLFVTPRLLGIKRWGISLLGILGACGILSLVRIPLEWRFVMTYLWLGSPLVFLPCIPWRIRIRIGKPIPPFELFVNQEGSTYLHALGRVEQTVESLMRYSD